ncbi:hypothetical protein [Mycolicibacterium llatzerense]|uniref:Integral membrane protein n=1 Tax=Mycolicibacterium llatzerense TaxID=280871 RepID=A0A0D1LPC9_9MYCO|nr:hypothetical protein [Mycolicibacterium llatzerense]KIU17946.1 hypothetical protein TL10_04580 [Mycolicibacterium llatzerense]MCT7367206.1 hypothetical protein [Mycolicibacterium llatzerense]MCT7371381.1 hypothetical protein [Mycolicibacterium llatzerense]
MATIPSPVLARSDGLLRFAMRLDAVLVGIAGLPFVAVAAWLAALTGVPTEVQLGLGLGFLAYGVVVYWLAGLDRIRPGGIATISANALYTVGSAGLAVAGVWPLTGWGYVLLFGGAAYTAVIGGVQYIGLRRI